MEKYDRVLELFQMKIEEVRPGFARVSMPLQDAYKNSMGAAHGGAIFSLADMAFGAAANADKEDGVVNLTSSIEYLRPGLTGPLMAEAREVRAGGHILSYDVRIFDGEKGNLYYVTKCGGSCTRNDFNHN